MIRLNSGEEVIPAGLARAEAAVQQAAEAAQAARPHDRDERLHSAATHRQVAELLRGLGHLDHATRHLEAAERRQHSKGNTEELVQPPPGRPSGIARIRDLHGGAVWVFDFVRLRRHDTMPAFFDTFTASDHDRLRVDAVASEAAAWTVEEMRAMLAGAGLTGLHCSRGRMLGIYQAWWATGTKTTASPTWVRPPMSEDAGYWADRTIAVMDHFPPA